MDKLKDRVIRYFNEFYIVKDVDIRGILKCHKITDKTINSFEEIDPLVNYTELLGVSCLSRLVIPGSSLSNLLYLVGKKVTACVAYKNSQDEILMLFGCENNSYFLYKLVNGGESVYIANIEDGKVVSPKNTIYTEMQELSGFEVPFNVKMYKLSDPIVGVTCYNILQGLLSTNDCKTPVDLSFLSSLDTDYEYHFVYITGVDAHDHILPLEECVGYLEGEKGAKVTRADVVDFIKSVYDYPCIHFSEPELEKFLGIVEKYKYPLRPVLERYNGQISNFYFESFGYSIAVLDTPSSESYEVRRLKCCPVQSVKGDTLFWELRSYPLAESSEYKVLCSSISEEYVRALLKVRYADIIRSSMLHYKGSQYYLKSFNDKKDSCTVQCYESFAPTVIYTGSYDKSTKTWSYSADVPKSARDFMSKLLSYFNDKYGILE